MYVIGLTGGIASGKTTAARTLSSLGAEVIDADAIARALTAPGGGAADAVLKRFGTLNRKEIGRIVFSDECARLDLNEIVHPRVTEEIKARVARSAAPVCVLDVPLLFEAGMEHLADEVWVVYVPRKEQVRRVMARDGLTEGEAARRIDSQMPTEEKIRRADAAIDTSGPVEKTQETLKALWADALRKAGAGRA